MRKIQIITDSCSDLTPELMARYGIDYAKMNTVCQSKASLADLAWGKEDVHALYDRMRKGERVTTTQVPVEEFNRVFRHYLEAGCDIVYVGCSSKQSGSVNTASVLARKLAEEYPDSQIVCIDSRHASMGEGMLAIDAARAASEGKSADEISALVEERSRHLHQFATVHTLDALRRAGRVKASSAFFGNLLGVKPIVVADADGEQAAFKKAKGRTASLREIVALLREHITEAEGQTIYLAHSDCSLDEVAFVRDLVCREIPCKDVYIGYIGPIIGASIGPDAIAVFGYGKEITFRIGA
jgi:DegV family protein with EDD domain